MNYNRTIICEANSLNKIHDDMSSNDFVVTVPQVNLPKGSTIELDGCIIEEQSAGNNEIIELSAQNISQDRPYTSSFVSLKIRFYANNAGMNTICQPMIQNNYSNIQADTRSPPAWGSKERWPYESSYVIPYLGPTIPIDLISGPKPFQLNTIQPNNNNPNNYGAWDAMGMGVIAYANPTFVDWDNNANNWTGFDNANSYGFNMLDKNSNLVDPADYNQNGAGLVGCMGMKSALKRNSPNNEKYTLIKSGYLGPNMVDRSEHDHIPDMEIYTDYVPIDLSNNLLETPDELAILINNQLQGSNIGQSQDYNVIDPNQPQAYQRNWSIDNYNTGTTDLYPVGSKRGIKNITSKTLINVRANFQNDQQSKVYGEGFFVKNPDKWISGNGFLKTNNRIQVSGVQIYGLTPKFQETLWGNTIYPQIYLQTSGNEPEQFMKFFPANLANSFDMRKFWTDKMTLEIEEDGNQYLMEFLNAESPPEFDPTDEESGFFISNADAASTPIYTHTNGEYFAAYVHGAQEKDGYLTQRFLIKYNQKRGNLILELYLAFIDNDGFFFVVNLDPLYYIPYGSNMIASSQITFISYRTGIEYPGNIYLFGAPIPTKVLQNTRDSAIINGLPYYALVNTNGGGHLANDFGAGNVIIDEYLCLDNGTLIPTNIKTRGEASGGSLTRVQNYFRANEVYCGQETTWIKQQQDNKNWYVELDVGFADDFNNAYSNWLSCKSEWGTGKADFTIYDEQQNFSVMPPYYQNLWTTANYGSPAAPSGGKGFNFRRPLFAYAISSFAKCGSDMKTSRNKIRVYSRYFEGLYDLIKPYNQDMNVDWQRNSASDGKNPQCLVPSYEVVNNDFISRAIIPRNIGAILIEYNNPSGQNESAFAFVNFRPTLQGNGEAIVEYDLKNIENPALNYRQCFRNLSGCPLGFDPASTTNPFCNAVNNQQVLPTNPMLVAKNFYSARDYDTSTGEPKSTELASWSDNNVYSGRYQDFLNYIWVGAVAPTIGFDNSRMVFSSFFTPRQFNAIDSGGSGDPNIGAKIAYFNDPTYNYPMLNNSFGSIPDTGPDPPKSHLGDAINEPGDYQQIRNFGICDSLSGIGIEDVYVRDEFSTGFKEGDKGVYKCHINSLDQAKNYRGSMLDLFGFKLRQLKPYYGLPFQRYSQHNYNSIGDDRYDGLSFFTLNSFINQSNSQNMDVYGPNYLVNNPSTVPRPPAVAGQPAYGLSFVGFEPATIQVDSDRLRSDNLPSKLQNAFYLIYSNLPNSRYITNNSEMNVIGYFYRQYKSGNYYFSYPTSYTKTLTRDYNLSSIRVAILNSNGRPAENLGRKVSAFFKFTIPTVLPEMDKETAESYFEANQNPRENMIQFQKPSLTDNQLLATRSISGNLANSNPFYQAIPDSEDDDPEYQFVFNNDDGPPRPGGGGRELATPPIITAGPIPIPLNIPGVAEDITAAYTPAEFIEDRVAEAIRIRATATDQPEQKESEVPELDTKENERLDALVSAEAAAAPPPRPTMRPQTETILGIGTVRTREVGLGGRLELTEFLDEEGAAEVVEPVRKSERFAFETAGRVVIPRALPRTPRTMTISDLPSPTPEEKEKIKEEEERRQREGSSRKEPEKRERTR